MRLTARKRIRSILLMLGAMLAAGLAVLFWLLRMHDPFPVGTGKTGPAEKISRWWESPPPLMETEAAAQQWLADITCRLDPSAEAGVWNVGGSQHGVFSIRYQVAFACYAASALGMRTPAYIGLTQAILTNGVARLADRRAWEYIRTYWSQEPWFPDPCAKGNVMYTGHLMQVMALSEALSGDSRYNRHGVDLVWDERHCYRYTTRALAEMTAAQIRSGNGGVTCEPGLVFFACNNHPHVTFRLLEGMGYGDWRGDSAKWERWALGRFRATAGGGAFRILHHEKTGLAFPRGQAGFDGWSLLWYAPWASCPDDVPVLWALAREKINWAEYGDDPKDCPVDLIGKSCCTPVQVPPAANASFLAAASRACGDAATAERLESWLDRHFMRQEKGRFWLNTHKEWRTGVTANRIIAIALANGSDLRGLVRRPLPRAYFKGLLLSAVEPSDTPVFQAYRDSQDRLVIEIDGKGKAVTLMLKNADGQTAVGLPESVAGEWNATRGELKLSPCRRVTVRFLPRKEDVVDDRSGGPLGNGIE